MTKEHKLKITPKRFPLDTTSNAPDQDRRVIKSTILKSSKIKESKC